MATSNPTPSTSSRAVGPSSSLNGLDWLALVLMIVGGLNWGLVALFNFDLVAALFGNRSVLSLIVYGLVGLAALYGIAIAMKFGRRTAV